jgi:hypothetical protein
MPDTLEVRIAHLEGAYEQIDKRLAGVETGLASLRQEMAQLRQQMYEQFRWIVGIQVLAWISILGTLLALLFRS